MRSATEINDFYDMPVKERIERMMNGELLETEDGQIWAYKELPGRAPFRRWGCVDGFNKQHNSDAMNYSFYIPCRVYKEQKLDRYGLIQLCKNWEKKGVNFLVRFEGNKKWRPWQFYSFNSDIIFSLENYQYTLCDPKTGQPIGEPKSFTHDTAREL